MLLGWQNHSFSSLWLIVVPAPFFGQFGSLRFFGAWIRAPEHATAASMLQFKCAQLIMVERVGFKSNNVER